MTYTAAEIDTAVGQLLRTSIRREYGNLGNRRQDLTFEDLKDAASGVFLLYSRAPFYVIYLAAQRVRQALAKELESVSELRATATSMGRKPQAISSVSPLVNARVALDALSGAASARTKPFANIEEVSSFQRFDQNLQRFLDDSGAAVKHGGGIVRTPAESRKLVAKEYEALLTEHADLVQLVQYAAGALEDFEGVDLASTLSAQVMANSRDVLVAHLEELESKTGAERLTTMRQVVLDVLAVKTAVKNFGSLTPPTTFAILSGSGTVFADDTHPATIAKLDADLYGPYVLVDGTGSGVELDFALDGDVGSSVTVTVPLFASYVAAYEATVKGTYEVTAATNDKFAIGLKNWSAVGSIDLVEVTLTAGLTQPVWTIAKEINDDKAAGSASMPLWAEPYANPLRFTGPVDIDTTPAFGTSADLISTGSVNFTDLGVEVGDWVRVSDATSANYGSGTSAFGAIFEVESINTTTSTDDTLGVVQKTALVLSTEASKVIEISEGTMPLRVRISDKASEPGGDYRVTAIEDRVAFYVPEKTGTVTKDEQFDATTTFGLFPLIEMSSRPTDTRDLVRQFAEEAAAVSGGTVRVIAGAEFVATHYSGTVRTHPDVLDRAVFRKFYATSADLAASGSVGTFTVAGALTAGAAVDDIIVVRTHGTAAQVDNWGTITSVSDTQVVATMNSAPVSDVGIEVEIGPDLSSIPFGPTLRVSDDPNLGDYEVKNVVAGAIPIELDLDKQFPFPMAPGRRPNVFQAELGQWKATFTSLDSSLQTAVSVDGSLPESSQSARTRFFSSTTSTARGTTKYFQLPEVPKSVEEGDVLELHTTHYATPDYEATISSVESDVGVLELEVELPANLGAYALATDSSAPFARIRKKLLQSYDTLSDSLESWLELDVHADPFWANARALVNELAKEGNPTAGQIKDVTDLLDTITATLSSLEGYLGAFEADLVPEVDGLIAAFKEKGADRAVDLLLQGRFSAFFGLDQDEVSYAGALQKQLKEVQKELLPVSTTGRLSNASVEESILASYDEPDFEFDTSDVDELELDVESPV